MRKDKRIDEIERDNETYIVHLARGSCLNDQGCHTFGEDTLNDIKKTMLHVKPCYCSECVR